MNAIPDAVDANAAVSIKCGECSVPLGDHYYFTSAPICERCALGAARSRLGRSIDAVLYGILALFACVALWALMIAFTGHEFGLVGIGVGAAVGAAVRAAAGRDRHRIYRAIAVAITYLAVNLGPLAYYLVTHPAELAPGELALLILALPLVKLVVVPAGAVVGLIILGVALHAAWRTAIGPAIPGPFSTRHGGGNPGECDVCHACGVSMPAGLAACVACGAATPTLEEVDADA